jgi:hypothetical protein
MAAEMGLARDHGRQVEEEIGSQVVKLGHDWNGKGKEGVRLRDRRVAWQRIAAEMGLVRASFLVERDESTTLAGQCLSRPLDFCVILFYLAT